MMAVLYIKEQGALLQKSGDCLVVTKGRNTLLEIPVIKAENISLIGNVQVTAQALYMLMQNGVDVSYFSYGGRYLGHTTAEASKNIFLRFEQYQFYLDESRRLQMAKIIVDNKIQNQIAVIRQNRWSDGFRKFCTEYERWLTGQNSVSGEKSFRTCIRNQVSNLKKSICSGEVYIPYNWSEHHVCNKL